MRALTFQGKRNVKLETIPDPRLVDPTDALVRVRLAGICGSDLHVYHERETGLDHGTAMGHEYVGEVVDVGKEVRGISRGYLVLGPFTTSCGSCFYCKKGLTARCETGQLFGWVQDGTGLHGTQAELLRVPLAESTLVPVPENVTTDEALLLGDVLSTGYYCAKRAEVRPGGVYAVVGCGPVGLMAIVGALELGAKRVFAFDAIPERLELARRFGAEAVDYTSGNGVETVREATSGRGADAVMEAVGSPSSMRFAVDLVRPGGTVSAVGVHTSDRFEFSPVEAYDKNLTYRIGRCPARAVMDELFPVVQKKAYDLSAVISHRLSLDEGTRGYDIFDRKAEGCTKVVLSP